MSQIEYEKINQKQWCKLYSEGVIDSEEYNLDSRFRCNKILNQIISENKFLTRLLFYDVGHIPSILPFKGKTIGGHFTKRKTIKELDWGRLPRLDHYQIIQFDENWSNIDGIDCFKGVFNFPYNHKIDSDFIDSFDNYGELWEAFIINPRFLQYNPSYIGAFYILKVDYLDELIYSLNGYFTKITGYPLLFKPTLKDIEEIVPIKPDLSRKAFYEDFAPTEIEKEEHIMFYKLLKFWSENSCVTVDSIQSTYEKYSDNIMCTLWIGFNLKRIESDIPFRFIHTETGEILGPFNSFEYDPAFDCYDADGKTHSISSVIKDNFKKGLYDIELCE